MKYFLNAINKNKYATNDSLVIYRLSYRQNYVEISSKEYEELEDIF